MLIKIYSMQHTLLGTVEEYTSLQYSECFAAVGTLCMIAPATEHTVSLLECGNLIHIDAARTYVIKYINLYTDDTGAEMITVNALHVLSEFARACTAQAASYTGTASAAIITAANAADNILDVEYTQSGVGTAAVYQIPAGNVLDAIISLCTVSDVGARCGFNPVSGKLTFTVSARNNRSAAQTQNPPVIISRQFDNVAGESYTIDISKYKNKCIIVADETVTVDKTGGTAEYCMYKRSTLRRTNFDSDAAYTAALAAEAEADLAMLQYYESYDFTISGDDACDVGDIITVSNVKYGIYLSAVISEKETIIESTGKTVNYTVGAYVPTVKQIYGGK